MRRAIILLMFALTGAFLGACGDAAETAHVARPEAARRVGATAGRPSDRPRALAFARAVNLTATDLPGFSVSSKHEAETASERRLQREVLGCAGPGGPGGGSTSEGSKDFELKHEILDLGVSSEVSVAQTPAAAAGELLAMRSPHVRGCFSRYLNLLFKDRRLGGASVGRVSIASGTPPAPGTAGGFGWRVTVPLTVHQLNVSLYLDILGFVDGPARVTLFSTGALRPFPAAVEQQLFSFLLDRARAHVP